MSGAGDHGDGIALPPVPEGVEPAEVLSAAQLGDRELWCAYRPLNDEGNAGRLVERWGHELRWAAEHGWYGWDGRRWSRWRGEAIARERAMRMAAAVAGEADALLRQRGEAAADRVAQLRKWRVGSGSRSHIDGALVLAQGALQVAVSDFDGRPDDLAVANGLVTLGPAPRFKAKGWAAERLGTRLCTAGYDPGAACPRWLDFLADVQPDIAIREFLWRWWGYCITGHISEQVLVLHYGTGANGKSTALDVITHVLGDYAALLPFEAMLEDRFKSASGPSPDIARLPGARFVISSEPDPGRSLAESQIKRLTGETALLARALRQDFFEFRPQFKLNLAANKRPRVSGQDHGTWRRILLVPWRVRVEEPVRGLAQTIIAEETDGVLAWLIAGAAEWYRRGLSPPAAIEAATAIYRGDNDPVGTFIAECCEWVPDVQIRARALYDAYEVYCRANAIDPLSKRGFGVALSDKGIERLRNDGIVYVGLRLRGGVLDELRGGTGDDAATVERIDG